jgi:hypothetical protein
MKYKAMYATVPPKMDITAQEARKARTALPPVAAKVAVRA